MRTTTSPRPSASGFVKVTYGEAKKNILHGLRTLHYALQLLRHGAIIDLQEVNHHWPEIDADPSTDWAHYQKRYLPLYQRLKKEVTALTEPKPIPPAAFTEERPLTLAYVERYGLSAPSTELDIFIKRDSKYPELVLLHPDKLCSPYSNPVVRECSSGLLVELTKPATAQANQDKSESEIENNERESESEEIRRLVCLPYPKVYELGHANAEQICDWSGAKVFRIEITDNARVVSLYHYADEWRICSSESSDCSDRICRVRVKHGSAEEPRREGGDDEEEEEDRYYLNFPSTTHYNPWNFFEEKLTKPRQAFAAFTTATSTATGQGPLHGDKNEDGAKEDLGEGMINKTFGDFFWEIWQERDYRFPEDTSLCYCFMTAVPAIQIFTHLTPPDPASAGQAWLSGVRDMKTLRELAPEEVRAIAHAHGWETIFDRPWTEPPAAERLECVTAQTTATIDDTPDAPSASSSSSSPQFPFPWPPVAPSSEPLDRILQRACRELDPVKCAGFLVVDDRMRRVKVVSPQYSALSRLSWWSGDEAALRLLLLEVVRANDHDSFIRRYPQWEATYRQVRQQFHALLSLLEQVYSPLISRPREEFLAAAQKGKLRKVLFKMARKSVCDVRDYLNDVAPKKLAAWMRLATVTHRP